jgi:hypothetical protein
MEDDEENEDLFNGTDLVNPHGIDIDTLPEHSTEVSWLDLNGLTAKEALGLSFERNFAQIRT